VCVFCLTLVYVEIDHGLDGVEELSSVFEDVESVSVECQYRVMEAIHVPVLNISAYPKPKGKEAEELEDWNMRSAALFEWVGMASLGAQRQVVTPNKKVAS